MRPNANIAASGGKFKTPHPENGISLFVRQPNLLNNNHYQYNQKKKTPRQHPFPTRVSFQIQARPENFVCQADKNNKKTDPRRTVTYRWNISYVYFSPSGH